MRSPVARRLCTRAAAPPAATASRPPFAIRVALVGTATGLFTPLFATAGVAIAWYRFMPIGPLGSSARVAISALIGGGALTLCYHHVWPFLREHAELVAPFALANGVSAALWYGLIDAAFGVEALGGAFSAAALGGAADAARRGTHDGARLATIGGCAAALLRAPLPLGGVAVGVATAASAPLLWPACIELLWPPQLTHALLGSESGGSALLDAYSYLFLPVALPVCIAAGASMHMLLAPLLVGLPRLPWTRAALPALGALGALSAAYMRGCSTPLASLLWERRLAPPDPGHPRAPPSVVSRNLLTGQLATGAREAERSARTRGVLLAWQRAREWWRALGRSLLELGGLQPARARAGRAVELEAAAERAELASLLADVRGTAGGAGAAAPAASAPDGLASVASPSCALSLGAISASVEPLDCLLDLCVCAALLAAGQAAEPAAEPAGAAAAAVEAVRARAHAELGVQSVHLLAANLCAAAALLAGGGHAPPARGPPATPEAQAMAARLCEHAAKLGGGTASDPHARRARVLTRALFAHVDTFDARLRALGVSVGDATVERATRRLRADERADAAWRAAGVAAQVAVFAGVGALVLRAVIPGGGSS